MYSDARGSMNAHLIWFVMEEKNSISPTALYIALAIIMQKIIFCGYQKQDEIHRMNLILLHVRFD